MKLVSADVNDVKVDNRGRHYGEIQRAIFEFIASEEVCCEITELHTSAKNLQTSFSHAIKKLKVDVKPIMRKGRLYLVNMTLRETCNASNGKEAEQDG